MNQRFQQMKAAFLKRYGTQPVIWVRAPGRVDLMGSHTGSLTFTVGLDQKAISGGQVRGQGFSGGFIGVIQGTTVRINAKGGSGITATMEGSLNPTTKRMSGTWKGVVNNHRADGSWSAALAK